MSARDVLERIYAKIPDVHCKGLCWHTCGPIAALPIEIARMEMRSGAAFYTRPDNTCPYLVERRCSVYNLRPFLCRLYGAVDDPRMRCRHGCMPDRFLTQEEARELMKEIDLEFGKCDTSLRLTYEG